MKKFNEDNNGFVNFPLGFGSVDQIKGKTLIYLIAFDNEKKYILNNTKIKLSGELVIDDISGEGVSINIEEIGSLYFPEVDENKSVSLPLVSAICIGWCDMMFTIGGDNWFATFRDLSSEGRKLYYTIKKLHNNKEIRILTITGIK